MAHEIGLNQSTESSGRPKSTYWTIQRLENDRSESDHGSPINGTHRSLETVVTSKSNLHAVTETQRSMETSGFRPKTGSDELTASQLLMWLQAISIVMEMYDLQRVAQDQIGPDKNTLRNYLGENAVVIVVATVVFVAVLLCLDLRW
eukprot:SAG31_NODE_12741_length_920_cov_0.846529_2_plen_146_part_01